MGLIGFGPAWDLGRAIAGATRKESADRYATVTRRDPDGVTWGTIAGADGEVPLGGTLADAAVGDVVAVEWRGGMPVASGNATAPSVGRVVVRELVDPVADVAESAVASAGRAHDAADRAEADAARAEGKADEATAAASTANAAAHGALLGLSTVEDVVDTLTWITKHGTMTLTTDTTVDPSKVYFVPDASGQYVVGGNSYSIVQNPTTEGLSGYYELTIDKSVENYIATHVAVTNEGLWLTPTSSSGYRVLIATGAGTTYTTAGTYIIDNSGNIRAIIGETITLGGSGENHVVIDANGFDYFNSNNYRVAHMGNDVRLSPRGYGSGLFMKATSEGGIGLSLSNQQGGSPEFPSGKAGNYSIAAGKSVSAVRMAVEGGQIVGLVPVDVGTDSTGSGSIAVGRALQALSDYQAVFGRMNVPDENGDYALIVGNGHAMTHEEEEEKAQEVGDGSFINIAHSNALTVGWDGTVDIGPMPLSDAASGVHVHGSNVSTADQTASASVYGLLLGGYDKDGNLRSYVKHADRASGLQGVQVETRRKVNGSNVYNGIELQIDQSGNRSVNVSDAAAWRSALGLNADDTWHSGSYSSPFSNYGNSSANAPHWRRDGNAVSIYGIATVTAQQADATRTLFTLPAGYRPTGATRHIGRMQGSGTNSWLLSITTGGEVQLARYGTTSAGAVAANAWLPFSATFII